MINNIPTRTAKPDALTALLRSDLPALGEIEVRLIETTPARSGEDDGDMYFCRVCAGPDVTPAEDAARRAAENAAAMLEYPDNTAKNGA